MEGLEAGFEYGFGSISDKNEYGKIVSEIAHINFPALSTLHLIENSIKSVEQLVSI